MATTHEYSLGAARNGLEEVYDFSLILGGPTFQLFRKAHLTGNGLELLRRRLVVVTLFAWLPLLLLNVFGTASETAGLTAFFRDIEVHARFLVALPVLIGVELLVHSRIRPAVRQFVEQRIVLPQEMPRFRNAIKSAVRLRNSVPVEVGLLFVVYFVGLWIWSSRVVFDVGTWYALPGSRWNLTLAGYWYVFVSLPLFQFILLRWYLRILIWFRFLWQVSRIDLNLIPTNPDRCGGLSFLGGSAYAFGPFIFAQGAIVAGMAASRIIYGGESLPSFKWQIVGFVAFFVFAVLGPLMMFTPRMASAKRKGLRDYGVLAQRYVENFDQKWVRDPKPSEELLFLGTPDIQSVADLANSYNLVRDMRAIPFQLQDITRLAAAAAAPFLPLLLTVFSPEELFMRALKVVF